MSDLQDLGCLKYSELQKLAKDVGIKANMKSDKLIKALEEHFKNHPSSSSSSYQAVKSDAVNIVSEETINTQIDIPKEQLDECEKPRPTRKAKKGKGRKKKVNKKLDLTDDGMDVNKVKSVEVERCKRKLSESDCDAEVQFKPLENGDDNSSESRPSKRRRETFEVVPSPLIKGDNAVTDRGDNLTADCGDNNDSLGEVMDAMKPEMSNTDLKDSLMAAIEKKVEQKISAEGDKEITTTTASHIPRFAAFLAKKKAADKKPITPGNKDWTKIHEKNFSKMDSIDVYLEKKRQRNQSISNSIKEAHEVASKTRETMNKLASHKTPVSLKVTKGLPLPFKPTVTSTKSMSFNFADTSKTPVFGARRKSAAGPVIPPKCDSQASLTRKSPRNAENTSVPGVRVQARKSVGSAINITVQAERRKSHVTPFKALNVTADNTSHKKVFDLAASLSKPLSWKPYTGKLKPLEPKVSNNKPKPLEPKLSNLNRTKPLEPKVSNIIRPKPLEGKLSSNSHYRNNSLKAPPLQNSRANRFADAKQRQADRKFNAQMKRRGIVA